ncbi:uncharacterized protein EKO05_0006407 [Ascochyta rabiei]|uniref:Uncharacterized protein n=1 Tax=Didymella rabiei TaxID=5454 RepID=A0A162WRU8_DIDRA|nr:uncharacterized protein EKO05_0006407 [Ascochyta rabiei]KZM19181.1 hypothetical protein ST47_g9670 [Ascochyta rabiei]UPX15978.1 hypothetical protein EKO05_0006407 [Ascochyta rabiei]
MDDNPNNITISRSFNQRFNEANKLWDEDQVNATIETARKILDDSAMPNYHRIETLILLALALPDKDEANRH